MHSQQSHNVALTSSDIHNVSKNIETTSKEGCVLTGLCNWWLIYFFQRFLRQSFFFSKYSKWNSKCTYITIIRHLPFSDSFKTVGSTAIGHQSWRHISFATRSSESFDWIKYKFFSNEHRKWLCSLSIIFKR